MTGSKKARPASKKPGSKPRPRTGRARPSVKTVTVDGRKYAIPVDGRGNVPFDQLVKRFLDVGDGDREGRARSIARDLGVTARKKIIVKDRIRPEEIGEWWAHPNEYDIVGLDDVKTPVFDTAGATRKSSLKYQRMIGITGASPKERRMIRKTLDSSFTADELGKITKDRDAIYKIGNVKNAAGGYSIADRTIALKRPYNMSPGTIVHETVHKLKDNDPSRKGVFTRSHIPEYRKTNDEYERTVEEAATTAETTARITPWQRVRNMSYYLKLPGCRDPDAAFAAMRRDRKLFVGNNRLGRPGLKGRRAVRSVETKFRLSEIGNLEDNGRKAKDYK